MLEAFTLSDLLGYASIGSWLGAQFPQVIENIRRQSCEGLALPFLANWLMGDISNLVGCILTHQLPFQTWLATYFVCVDFMLVAQYAYYYKAPKGPPSALGHIRSATSPAAIRRMSIDRGASRYRTLSAVASNVAAAAALAAQQDGQTGMRGSNARYPHGGHRAHEGSTSVLSRGLAEGDEGYDGESSGPLADSFHSEGGRDIGRKRVSWSIERHRGRAASAGRTMRPITPTALQMSDSAIFPHDPDALVNEPSSYLDTNESSTPVVSSRGSRATRRGSTMVFLGAWALFGIGTIAGNRQVQLSRTTDIGRVLFHPTYPISTSHTIVDLSSRALDVDELEVVDLDFVSLNSDVFSEDEPPQDPHNEEPSSEQVLGRIFAWLCTTLYLTSRLPQIWKNYARKSVEGLSMYLFVFAFLGNVFYVASILTSPKHFLPPPASTQYIRESIPYLIGSGGTLLFDITIVSQSFIYRPRPRRHAQLHSRAIDEEEAGLLSGDPVSAHPPGDSAILNRGRTSRTRGAV